MVSHLESVIENPTTTTAAITTKVTTSTTTSTTVSATTTAEATTTQGALSTEPVSIFTSFGDGTCSTDGYEKLKDIFKVSNNDVVDQAEAMAAFNKFRVYIGGLSARTMKECGQDIHIVPCNLLDFPEGEIACLLAQRVRKLFSHVVNGCKMSKKWNRKWATTMQRMLTNSMPMEGECPELFVGEQFAMRRFGSDDPTEFSVMVDILVEQELERLKSGSSEISKGDRKLMGKQIFADDDEELEGILDNDVGPFMLQNRMMQMDVAPIDEVEVGYLKFYLK